MKVIDLTSPDGAMEVLANILYEQALMRGKFADLKEPEILKALLLAGGQCSLMLQLLGVIDEDKVADIYADVEVAIEKRRAELESSSDFAKLKEHHDRTIKKRQAEGGEE